MTNSNEQYFTSDPTSAHSYKEIAYSVNDKNFRFLSDSGVFSRTQIDYGTNVMLKTFLRYSDKTGKVLDLGTGYGVVGTVVNKLTKRDVDMVDVNQRALDLANKNLASNGATGSVFISDIYDQVDGKYDTILTNPPVRAGKDIVTKMLVDAKQHLNPGGEIFVVLQKKQGAPSAQNNLENTFGNVDILAKDKGYYILYSINND